MLRADAAGSLSDYRLLVLDGARAKWGSAAMGSGAVVTYAVATEATHTADAINCSELVPPGPLLAANRVSVNAFGLQLAAAFAAWSAVANLTFVPVADPASADILIGAEGVPGGRAFTNVATTAAARLPSPTRVAVSDAAAGSAPPATITRSLICLNPETAWKVGFDGNLDAYDLRYALMHEIGHAIGLDHPDSVNAVMDFHYTEAFSALQPGDIAGVVSLYGPRPSGPAVAAVPAFAAAGVTH